MSLSHLLTFQGTKNVLGISLDIDEIDEFQVENNSVFKGMRNLRFLDIYTKRRMSSEKEERLHLLEGLDYLPPKLRLLRWDRCPMRCMPSKFCPKYLVKLKMEGSKLEKLWEGVVVRFLIAVITLFMTLLSPKCVTYVYFSLLHASTI